MVSGSKTYQSAPLIDPKLLDLTSRKASRPAGLYSISLKWRPESKSDFQGIGCRLTVNELVEECFLDVLSRARSFC